MNFILQVKTEEFDKNSLVFMKNFVK